jgi:twinkle protein
MEFSDLGIKEKSGRQRYATQCPQCNDKRVKHKGAQCLTVNDEPGNRFFKCHHCGWSGNLDVQDRYEVVRTESKMPSQQRAYTMKVRDYLLKRGISQTTAKKAKLYESQMGNKTIICFPYFMNLTLVNVKFLNMDWVHGDKGPKWWQLKKDIGTRIIPFGLQHIKTHDDQGNRYPRNVLILTEGEWDMLTWMECGYTNVASVPQGAPSLNSKDFDKEFAYLQDKYVQSVLSEIDIIYLSVDNDEPGIKLRGHLAMILGKDRCRIIRYPHGYKDINEVLMGDEKKGLPALGKKAVDECLANSASVPIKGVIKVSDVYDELEVIRNDGFTPGLGCGVPEVDKLFTVKPKLIQFTTGVPGCFGKDQLIHTSKGVKKISEIKANDKVLTYNHDKDVNEYRTVIEPHKYKDHEGKLYKITLKDGTVIKVTDNHKFYTGISYLQISEIISMGKIVNGDKQNKK